MHTIDFSKCKQCDGELSKQDNRYLPCPFCSVVDTAMQTLPPTAITEDTIKMIDSENQSLPVIDSEKDKYCQDFISAMSVMGHLLKNKLIDQDRFRKLLKVENDKLSDDALKIKIAESMLNWQYIRIAESEYYQTLQKRSKQFLEVDKTKSYTELFVPTKPKDSAPAKASKQVQIIVKWQKQGISIQDCNKHWLAMFPTSMSDSDRKAKEKQMLLWCGLGIRPEKQQALWISMGNKI